MQSVYVSSLRIPIVAFELGLLSSFSSLVLVAALVIRDRNTVDFLTRDGLLISCLTISERMILVGQSLGALCIPRRPDVFCGGRLVDRYYTESLLSRITWSWCAEEFQNGSEKEHLAIRDLPGPNRLIRAKVITADWQGHESGRSLWKSIALSHQFKFALQWALTVVGSLLDLAPQLCVLQFLQIIEQRDIRRTPEDDAWPWVVGIALTMMAQSWTESYCNWISSAELCIPIRTQLSSLIFKKTTRRQKPRGRVSSENQATQSKSTKEEEFSTDGDNVSTTNLFSADVRRVSDFCSYNRYLPGSLCKLAFSCILLLHLLGWQPLLSGVCAMLAITPINALYSRRYAKVQGHLMTARDEKVGFVSEALSGLRFIKFSALEREWEEKINRLREKEVSRIAEAFWYDTILTGCWIASPIMLAIVCLGVYASIHGTLSPSVAFVSLAVFDSLQAALSFVPELVTMFYDARISSRRIDDYLQCPEIENSTEDAEEITFDDATIAWPVDPGERFSDVFMLRNVTLRFPRGELSIISGQTGSGKSLMLAAILGDVDVLAGSVRIPKELDLNRPNIQHAMTGHWIIPNKIAFVAQTAWLENKTIKENIHFGLPHLEERYRKTIDVCALRPDLDVMEDGDNTEIGPNGTNLSGGQKCRITIARAIYSRAGILVLDDIFSAVDVHVGRQILEDCLNGELGVGRTRIIATHHVELCRPYARYISHLSAGSANVVPTNLSDQLTQGGFTSSNTGFQRCMSNYEMAAQTPSKAPHGKRFVEEETRAQGAIKKHVYLAFLEASGGRFFWCCMVSLYIMVQALIIGKSWWLRIWTGSYKESTHEISDPIRTSAMSATVQQNPFAENVQLTTLPGFNSLNLYLGVYIFLSLASAFLGTVKLYYMFSSTIKASRELFTKLNFAVLRAPLRWLDTVPRGRILNRYTADFHSIDTHLARYLEFGLSSFFNIIGIILTGLCVSPAILALATILILASVFYARYYLRCARPVKRLESIMRSPVFEHFDSTLCGVATIRAFAKVNDYTRQMDKNLDDWAVTTWHLQLFKEWMAWRITALGAVFASSIALVIWLNPGVDAALAGFALAFSLEISKAIL
jgi:ABC-type multidrug transport system fused ATPase/permease subunit